MKNRSYTGIINQIKKSRDVVLEWKEPEREMGLMSLAIAVMRIESKVLER